MVRKLNKYHWRNIRGLVRAKDGISAVEFALIAPLMLLIYFGCIELSFMMILDRKVTTSTATLGDLTARASQISNTDLDEIFQATRMIFEPNDITTARMRITSIYDDSGTIKVAWSEACSLTPHTVDAIITVPANIVPANGTAIMAEIEYDYNSALGYFFTTTKTLKDTFYLRPRRVDAISRKAGDGAYACAQFAPGP